MKRRGNGEGSIIQRKSGSWLAQVMVTQTDGSRRRVSASGKSREIVKEKLCALLEQESRRIPYAEKNWTVAEYLDYWLREIQQSRIRETTMVSYSLMVRRHINPTMGNHKLRDLSVHDVRRALSAMTERGCSEQTKHKCLRVLSSCLHCAMREELVFRNVAQLVEKPKYVPKKAAIWTMEQAAQFLEVARSHSQYVAFLLFLVYGMRRGEVLGLRYCDIDFENNTIYVRQQINRINGAIKAQDVKTANSFRDLPMTPDVRAALLEHAQKHGATPVFSAHFETSTQGTVIVSEAGTPLEPRNLARCFENLVKKAGVPRIKIHEMRHTEATFLKDIATHVKDAQLILGHSNVTTTMNIYQHSTAEARRSAISTVENLLCKK